MLVCVSACASMSLVCGLLLSLVEVCCDACCIELAEVVFEPRESAATCWSLADCELVEACDLEVCEVDGVLNESDVEALVKLVVVLAALLGVDDALMALAMLAALVTFAIELPAAAADEFMVLLAALLALVVVYCLWMVGFDVPAVAVLAPLLVLLVVPLDEDEFDW